MKYLIIALALTGCSYFQKKSTVPPTSDNGVASLRALNEGWLSDLKSQSDQTSYWPSYTDCDGTLWAGLSASAGEPVDLDLAEPSSGFIVRSPGAPCTPTSRDMILGYAYGRWSTGNLGALQRLATYGENNSWDMSSDASLSSIDDVSKGILGRAIDVLSLGKDKRSYENFPMACLPLTKDYEQHLQTLLMLLSEEISSKSTGGCVDVIDGFAKGSPKDALFAAAAGVFSGDMGPAIAMILDPTYVCPTYVRGAPTYCLVHKTFVARVILRRYP